MRILQIGKFYPLSGGVEKVMYLLMCGLSQKNVECDMLCASAQGGNSVLHLNDHAHLYCSRTLLKCAGTMISPAMIWKLYRISGNYDIIHIHHPDPMAALSLYLSGYKGKVILHWHSDILRQKTLLKAYLPLQKWLVGRADAIIGTSPIYLKESPYLKGVQEKTLCLPIGIEPLPANHVKADEIKKRYAGRKIIYSLGRMVEYKGFKYLVDAARYLSDEYAVVLAGDGPLMEDIRQQIKSQHLERKIYLVGRLADNEVAAYYQACTLFCLPSVIKTEAFGIVQIEAMSFGKPVVTTKIPGSGVSWVNEDGHSGINVEPCDAKALADAIVKITSDQETYVRFCCGARDNYEKRFTEKKMIEDCIKIYKHELYENQKRTHLKEDR